MRPRPVSELVDDDAVWQAVIEHEVDHIAGSFGKAFDFGGEFCRVSLSPQRGEGRGEGCDYQRCLGCVH